MTFTKNNIIEPPAHHIRALQWFGAELITSAFYEAKALLKLIERPDKVSKRGDYLERLEECREFFYANDCGAGDVIESFDLTFNLSDLKKKIDALLDRKILLQGHPKSATAFDVIEAKSPEYPKNLRDEIKRETQKQKFSGQLEFYFFQRLETTPRTVRPKFSRTHTLRVLQLEQTQLWEAAK